MNAQLLALAANWRVVAGANENSSRGHDDHSLTAALLTNCARELEAALAAPKEAGDYLLREIDRALNGDVLAVLMDVQNGIDSPGLAGMANSAIRRLEYVKELAARLAAPSKEAGPSEWCATALALVQRLETAQPPNVILQQLTILGDMAALLRCMYPATPPGDHRQEGAVARDCTCYGYEGRNCRRCFDPPYPDASPPPEAAEFADEGMALHWIDRYAAGIDDVPQLDRIAEALASPTGPQPAGGGVVALLRDCDSVAKHLGMFGALDRITDDGQPYQSQHLADLLAAIKGDSHAG